MADEHTAEAPIPSRLARLVDLSEIAPKEYYSIGEVCEISGLKPHVLRYWETQFRILSPTKNRAGNRAYRRKEIETILILKYLLYEEKYTIEGARQRLERCRRGEDQTVEIPLEELPHLEVMKLVEGELKAVLDELRALRKEYGLEG